MPAAHLLTGGIGFNPGTSGFVLTRGLGGFTGSQYSGCLLAAKRAIQSLHLVGAPPVRIRKVPIDRNMAEFEVKDFPSIILSPFTEEVGGRLIQLDDITYSVICWALDRDNQEGTARKNLNRTLNWSSRIQKYFHLPNAVRTTALRVYAARMINCQVQGIPIPQQLWQAGYFAKPLLLKFTTREERGDN